MTLRLGGIVVWAGFRINVVKEPGFRRKYLSRIEGHLCVAAAYSLRISDLDSIDLLV